MNHARLVVVLTLIACTLMGTAIAFLVKHGCRATDKSTINIHPAVVQC